MYSFKLVTGGRGARGWLGEFFSLIISVIFSKVCIAKPEL